MAFKLQNEEPRVKFTNLGSIKELIHSLCSFELVDMGVKPVEFVMTSPNHNKLIRYKNLFGELDELSHDLYDFN